MEDHFAPIVGPGEPLTLGIVLYPDMTALDFVGPLTVLTMACTKYLLWKTLEPVPTDTGFSIVPTCTFADCPERLDILLVPGGFGSTAAMVDIEVISFLQSQADARYVTAVCTGSTVLAAAGLLDGFQAATHWAYAAVLEAFGINSVQRRVVIDQNRITAGGVTAGIDFGLTLLARLRGDDAAKRRQLLIEYDPQPPFNAGHPGTAEPRITKEVREWLKEYIDDAISMVRRVSKFNAVVTRSIQVASQECVTDAS